MKEKMPYITKLELGALKKLKLPRAPLPKQTGGAHRRKNKVLDRKKKHKKAED